MKNGLENFTIGVNLMHSQSKTRLLHTILYMTLIHILCPFCLQNWRMSPSQISWPAMMSYLSQLYNCFRRESMLHFNEFFFRSFVVARVKVHFRFRLVFLILKTVKLTCLSLQTSIWRVFQTFVARAQFHFKLAWKVRKKMSISQYFSCVWLHFFISKCFDLTSFFSLFLFRIGGCHQNPR